MGKRLVIEPHLSVEELQSHYRRVTDPIERTRYQIIWLLAKGLVTEEVVSVTGYHPDRIRRIARRYNQSGPQGLIDGRRSHPGRTPMLSDPIASTFMASTQLFGRGWWTVEWSCICRLGGAIEGKANSQAAWVGIFAADEFQTTRATSPA